MARGTTWGDLIERVLKNAGCDMHIQDIYTEVMKTPEAKEKGKSLGRTGQPINPKHQLRGIIRADTRFKRVGSGMWSLATETESKADTPDSDKTTKEE